MDGWFERPKELVRESGRAANPGMGEGSGVTIRKLEYLSGYVGGCNLYGSCGVIYLDSYGMCLMWTVLSLDWRRMIGQGW